MACPDERTHQTDTRCATCGTTFHAVDPDSELGKVMARAREAWAQNGRPPSPDDFVFSEPIPVDLDE